jgi:hypothetical protein
MIFDSTYFGPEGLTKEDCQYTGSRYSEIREQLFANAYYLNDGIPEEPLPVFGVTLGRVLRGVIPCAKRWLFRQAAGRAVDSPADMRWGSNRRGYRRLLHPNGICLFGRWKIDNHAPSQMYSGYFQPGREALIVARYSTCCTETRRGNTRSLALVGKLFPTDDESHSAPLRTANFITQENIGGAYSMSLQDAVLRNAPDTSPLRRGLDLPILLVTALVFRLTDREIDNRQLYEIAELGKPSDQPTSTPEFMQLKLTGGQPVIDGDNLDFRNEILKHIYAGGEPATVRPLSFDIEVTDGSRKRGLLSPKRDFLNKWNRIGTIEFHEAVASYNGDFVLHFRHPPWRADRNDPTTVMRYKHREPC